MDDSRYTLFNLTTRLIFSVPISNDIMSELCRFSHGIEICSCSISYSIFPHFVFSNYPYSFSLCYSTQKKMYMYFYCTLMFFALPCVGQENAWDVMLPDVLFRSILTDVLTTEYKKFTHCI